MSYLLPPPDPSPVVVVKDVGGWVNEYAAQTEFYRRTNREVRLHECRSACTMALSLPNVCVYPDSLLKFHQAYDPTNHVTNWQATDALFQTYPVAVRERLGTPTKQYTVLRGSELIDLGVRNCNERGPRVMIAAATIKPLPSSMTSGVSSLSMLTGRLQGLLPGFGAKPEEIPGPKVARRPPAVPDGMLQPTIPLPPERPAEIETAVLETGAPDQATPADPNVIPLPPPRPKILIAFTPSLPPIPMMKTIDGSQPILPARFVPFPKRVG